MQFCQIRIKFIFLAGGIFAALFFSGYWYHRNGLAEAAPITIPDVFKYHPAKRWQPNNILAELNPNVTTSLFGSSGPSIIESIRWENPSADSIAKIAKVEYLNSLKNPKTFRLSNRNDCVKYVSRSEPWCAGFVSWVTKTAGYTDFPKIVSAKKMESYLSEVGVAWYPYSFLKLHQNELAKFVKPGDIIIINSHGQSPSGRHTGVITGIGSSGFWTIEGNVGHDEILSQPRQLDPNIIIGIGRPAAVGKVSAAKLKTYQAN